MIGLTIATMALCAPVLSRKFCLVAGSTSLIRISFDINIILIPFQVVPNLSNEHAFKHFIFYVKSTMSNCLSFGALTVFTESVNLVVKSL